MREFDFPVEVNQPAPQQPCYYSEPPRHVDPGCTDGGMASYVWTYTTTLGVDFSREVIYTQIPVTKTEPDFYLCSHHAASWRKQAGDVDVSAEYEIRSLP